MATGNPENLQQVGSHVQQTRRHFLAASMGSALSLAAIGSTGSLPSAMAREQSPNKDRWQAAIDRGLAWVAKSQSRLGHWTAANYPVAMTALAGTALTCSGSTTTQGAYAEEIRKAVDYLISKSRPNGLIGDPLRDNRYIYGHGFSMLFLSQVLGEEEDMDRRSELIDVLAKAAEFSINAQTEKGGWGYVSAKDQANFDEGSTTITQVQGLRGCRNSGITVPKAAIEAAKQYIYDCQNADGGISYSLRNKGTSRPAITAAALAALQNAGDYESENQKSMLKYVEAELHDLEARSTFGHWQYTYLYYSQVVYRQGEEKWNPYRDRLYDRLMTEQQTDGSWTGNIGEIYITACNLIMLQLDHGFLPIYQR
jgi:squalene cyclase